MEKNNWVSGYKEMRNLLHNEMGLTKEHIETIIAKITQDEIKHVLGENGEFIRSSIRQIIREEIMLAVYEIKHPNVERYKWGSFKENNKKAFNEFVSDTLKDEIIEQVREQFRVDIQIEKKQ